MENTTDSRQRTQNADTQTVIFRLNHESYGIDIFRVSEIIRPREITPVPLSQPHVLGVVNLRGKSIPVVDLRRRLQIEATETTNAHRIIVVDTEKGDVGVMVDAVTEVTTIYGEDIQTVPALHADPEVDFVKAVAKHDKCVISLLDLDRALAA